MKMELIRLSDIMRIMGDQSKSATKKSDEQLIQDIIKIGIEKSTLRDEIYCQIFKQTNGNPKPYEIQIFKFLILSEKTLPKDGCYSLYVSAVSCLVTTCILI